MTVYDAAREAAQHFITDARKDGSLFDRLRDDAPQWVQDLVRRAHYDMLPDDHRYTMIRSAIDALADADPNDDPKEVLDDWAPDAPGTSTSERTAWLASHAMRSAYCDEALYSRPDGIFELLGAAWELEAREVGQSILWSLEDRAAGVEA